MRILVAGGTGLVGSAITRALLRDGHDVTILTRSKPRNEAHVERVSWAQGDVTDPTTLPAALAGHDVVVDAVQFPGSPMEDPGKGLTFERIDLGGTKNLVDTAKVVGTRHFIAMSGAGAAPDAQYHWQRFKWEEEQHILGSGLSHTIFRPSWVYGPQDVSLNRFLGFAKFLPFIPVIGDGQTRINPLFVDDLGRHVAASVAHEGAVNRTFEIGGPQVLTMDEIVEVALRVAGKRRFLLHQPKPLMKLVGAIAQFVPGRPLTPDAIDFVTMDGVSDTRELEQTFGLPLTPLEEGLASYLRPS